MRHLRTSAGGGGKEGRAGELAQAAGTTGAHSPWSASPFPVWPQPLANLEPSFPPECELRLKFLFVFRAGLDCRSGHLGPERKASHHFLYLCWVVPSALHRSKELGLNLGKKRDLFLVNCPGVGRQPRAQPTTQFPGQDASSSCRLWEGVRLCREASGGLQSSCLCPNTFQSRFTIRSPTTTVSPTRQGYWSRRRGNHQLSKVPRGDHKCLWPCPWGRASPGQGGEESLAQGLEGSTVHGNAEQPVWGSIRDAGSKWVEMELAVHAAVCSEGPLRIALSG